MKALVTFNHEKALVVAFSVIANLRMDLPFKLYLAPHHVLQVGLAVAQEVDEHRVLRGEESVTYCRGDRVLLSTFMAGKLTGTAVLVRLQGCVCTGGFSTSSFVLYVPRYLHRWDR